MHNYSLEADILEEEGIEILKKADIYSKLLFLNSNLRTKKMNNLYKKIYCAQEEGEDINSIVGDNIDSFLKNYFRKSKSDVIITLLHLLYSFIWVELFYNVTILICIIKYEKRNILSTNIRIGSSLIFIIYFMMLFFIVVFSITNSIYIFHTKQTNIKQLLSIERIMTIVIFTGILVFVYFLSGNKSLCSSIMIIDFSISIPIVTYIICLLLYVIAYKVFRTIVYKS